MQVALGAEVVATLAAPSPLPSARMGARIETPVTRAIQSYWRPALLDEVAGAWVVHLEPPVAAGDFLLVWRTGDAEPPEMEVFVPLTVA